MKDQQADSYRERYAAHLLRWAKINPALPKSYATMALDRLRQRGVLGVTDQQVYRVKNDGNMPETAEVMEVLEQIAREYHPDKIRSDKEARKFLRNWEQRPGRKVQAALQAAA